MRVNNKKCAAEYVRISKWYHRLQSTNRAGDHVMLLQSRLNDCAPGPRRDALLDSLQSEFMRQNRDNELRSLLQERINEQPKDAMFWISVAGIRFHHLEDAERALAEVDKAVLLSRKSGHFRRHALNTKARIVLKLGQYELFEQCLLQIAGLKFLPGKMDIGPERDFFDRADKSKLSVDTVIRFEKYLAAYIGKDRK